MPLVGGGMTPVRLDRPEIRGRMAEVPAWVVDELCDDFETAALSALAETRKSKTTPGEGGDNG